MTLDPILPAPQRMSGTMRADVLWLSLAGAGIGWVCLATSIVIALPGADMAAYGPGMGIFNRVNGLGDLPASVRQAIAVLCEPSAARSGGSSAASGVFLMWMAMVLAMMLPGAAPAMGAARVFAARGRGVAILLGAGYLTAWTGFAGVATALQITLVEARLMRAAMVPMTDVLAGMMLVAAGIYQLTPWKAACLQRCRNPAPTFFVTDPTTLDIYRQGVRLGLDCLGCCFALMAAMFALGIMNVIWIAILTAVMTLEKLTRGMTLSRIVGAALMAAGIALIAASPIGRRLLVLVWSGFGWL